CARDDYGTLCDFL
nr:immunoglobulin heavy chain junction region [Macaca mulatta]